MESTGFYRFEKVGLVWREFSVWTARTKHRYRYRLRARFCWSVLKYYYWRSRRGVCAEVVYPAEPLSQILKAWDEFHWRQDGQTCYVHWGHALVSRVQEKRLIQYSANCRVYRRNLSTVRVGIYEPAVSF